MERMNIDPKQASEKTGNLIENAKGSVQDVVKNVTAEVSGRYEAARDMIDEYREKDFSEILDDASGFVRSHPIPMIVGALFLGYGLGRLFTSKS
jgi:hypothetical protein